MATSLRWIEGTQPGQLDPSQPKRVLHSESGRSTLAFAEYSEGPLPPQALEPLNQLFSTLQTRRIAVETFSDGQMRWRLVPTAVLRGVPDEGAWPRPVNFMGHETVMMTHDQWCIHKLDPEYVCTIDVNFASIWPNDHARPQPTPISPPATDSDMKPPKSGAGTSSQPYVLDDTDRASAPRPVPSPPFSGDKAMPNPYAARVSSVSESEDDDELDSSSSDTPQPDVDIPIPNPSTSAQHADDETQRSGKRKATSSPPKERARSHSVISISSDSGAETATPRRPKRPANRAHVHVYRRALFDTRPGPHVRQSSFADKESDVGNKRRKLDTEPGQSLPSYQPQFTETPVNVWPAPTHLRSRARSTGISPSPRRPGTSLESPSSPARKRARVHPASNVFFRAKDDPPIKIPFKRSQPFPSGESSQSESERPSKKPRTSASHSSKRRASHSPEVEEIPGPIPSSSAKRQRTDTYQPPATPLAKARQERAELKAHRDKARKATRPTSVFFGDGMQEDNVWYGVQSPFAGPSSQPRPSPAYVPYESSLPTSSFATWDQENMLPPLRPDIFNDFGDWSLPGIDEHFLPKAKPGGKREAENLPNDDDVFGDDNGDADAEEDDDDQHAAAIEASKRKLAELERDRPLWEESARRQRQEEEFARRQKEAKARREEHRRKEQAAHAEAEKKKAQERLWRKVAEQRAEEIRRERERMERESRAYSNRKRASNTFDTGFEDFKSHSHGPFPSGSRFSAHAKRAGAPSPSKPWTASQALERYNKQCTTFDAQKYTENNKLRYDEIPWPVLARSPIAVQHIDWDTVGEFFKAVKKLLSEEAYAVLVDKSHKRWHPDRWRSRTGAFRFIEGSPEQRDEVEKKVNMVSQVLTPLWQDTR